ncbi:hypothetical protein NC652_032750 [Populus alba x Populus x berolinensis]|nr:hypothetical protein NC652_032750 [Populus alba x Populus x berolinensis]
MVLKKPKVMRNERNLPNRQKTHESFNHEMAHKSQKRKQLRKSEDKKQHPKTANKIFTDRSEVVDLLKKTCASQTTGLVLFNSYSTGEVKRKKKSEGRFGNLTKLA